MRRVLLSAAIVLVLGAFIVVGSGFTGGPSNPTYKLEFDNAFGLVNGAPFKVAGVPPARSSRSASAIATRPLTARTRWTRSSRSR